MARLKVKTAYQRFVDLSWLILEHKYRYYILDNPTIEDHTYDSLEREYKDYCKVLGLEPYTTNMVGFDIERFSCKRIVEAFSIGHLK